MPKHDFLSPKAIGNRIKSKGLQRLKWYCQMCEKQCRDENGFKCHMMSESHQLQLLLFAETPGKFVHSFSKEFLDGYLDLLKRRFNGKRVYANRVYQEYIGDKQHIHMNGTMWRTLTGFMMWLGKNGYAHIDQTERGWYVQYIDRSPEAMRREKRQKDELDDEEAYNEAINAARERDIAILESKGVKKSEPQELHRTNPDEKITFRLAPIKRRAGEDEPPASCLKQEPNSDPSASASNTYSSSVSPVNSTTTSVVPNSELQAPGDGASDSFTLKREPQDASESCAVTSTTTGSAAFSTSTSSSELKPASTIASKAFALSLTKRFGVASASSSASSSSASAVDKKPPLSSSSAGQHVRTGDREERAPEKRKSAMETIREEETRAKQRRLEQSQSASRSSRTSSSDTKAAATEDEPWLRPGILVKINNEKLPDKYHAKKAVVLTVDGFVGIVRPVEGAGERLRIDQAQLETVVPPAGSERRVLVLLGEHRGREGRVLELDVDRATCTLLLDARSNGRPDEKPLRVRDLPFDYVCKLNDK